MKRRILLTIVFCSSIIISQNKLSMSGEINSVWIENESAEIFPVPVKVSYTNEYYDLYSINDLSNAVILAVDKNQQKAAAVLNNMLSKYNYQPLPVINEKNNKYNDCQIIIGFEKAYEELIEYGDQAYKISFESKKKIEVKLSGGGKRGLIYAAISLINLIVRIDDKVKIRRAEVFDYPKFKNRFFNAESEPNHLQEDLDWMLRYKLGSIAFHNKDYSWQSAGEVLKQNLEIYKEWKDRYGGVNALLILNLYIGEHDIEITNEEHVSQLKEFIKLAYDNGVSRFMINADDSPPFNYGEGYVLTSEKDKEKFSSMAEAHCWLMNNIYDWAMGNNYEVDLMYCPGFYTYEEMHYGDMELFKNTPWEKDAYGPLNRDLKIIGEQMNRDIEIMWTGPYVCTRVLTDDDILQWKENLQGRTPFLFDNTLYAQLEFTIRSLFTAYDNEFPNNFSEKTGGNGIFLNGHWVNESYRAEAMTANAYMWEEGRYNPEVSLIHAMRKLYGSENINLLLKYRDAELKLWKLIKQRELWFAADELWQSIREIRFITEKNPFYYHQNYGRFKALRLQLKHSVPEPMDVKLFKDKCMEIDNIRENLLKEIENRSFKRLSNDLRKEMIELPSFEKIN